MDTSSPIWKDRLHLGQQSSSSELLFGRWSNPQSKHSCPCRFPELIGEPAKSNDSEGGRVFPAKVVQVVGDQTTHSCKPDTNHEHTRKCSLHALARLALGGQAAQRDLEVRDPICAIIVGATAGCCSAAVPTVSQCDAAAEAWPPTANSPLPPPPPPSPPQTQKGGSGPTRPGTPPPPPPGPPWLRGGGHPPSNGPYPIPVSFTHLPAHTTP